MTATPWSPPRPSHHLRIFGISLGLVVLCLGAFLFGVNLEAVTPAQGIVLSRDQQEIRTPIAGLVEPGWFEDTLGRESENGAAIAVRFDRNGDGITDPAFGPSRTVHADITNKPFHALRAGDELWPGQILAQIRPDHGKMQLAQIEERLRFLEERGEPLTTLAPLRAQRDWLRDQLAQSIVRVPETGECWLVLSVAHTPLQAVLAGDLIATIAPIDPASKQPRDLVVRLDVEESHSGFVDPGELVRLYSPMFNHRLHGWAEAVVERVEPHGEAGPKGDRQFHVWARVTHSPFNLKLGSSCKAEIVVGRKPVYRIILEH